MRKSITMPALLGALAAFSLPAWAGPAYTSDDIVKAFAPPDLGPTRALCIGTEAECAKGVAPPKVTANQAFDLVVTFDYNSENLTDAARANLDQFAKALRDPRLSAASFNVEGHTDGRGSETFNLGLSQRRAQAVVHYLQAQGVDAVKVRAHGFGKLRPKVPDPLAPENRRVETRLRIE
jgi:outer membrane protein OmpA-like peptidoglycan-associated protein